MLHARYGLIVEEILREAGGVNGGIVALRDGPERFKCQIGNSKYQPLVAAELGLGRWLVPPLK